LSINGKCTAFPVGQKKFLEQTPYFQKFKLNLLLNKRMVFALKIFFVQRETPYIYTKNFFLFFLLSEKMVKKSEKIVEKVKIISYGGV
jgi:hypothetical protein